MQYRERKRKLLIGEGILCWDVECIGLCWAASKFCCKNCVGGPEWRGGAPGDWVLDAVCCKTAANCGLGEAGLVMMAGFCLMKFKMASDDACCPDGYWVQLIVALPTVVPLPPVVGGGGGGPAECCCDWLACCCICCCICCILICCNVCCWIWSWRSLLRLRACN